MANGLIGNSKIEADINNNNLGQLTGPTLSYTCPSNVRYAVLTIHYSLSASASTFGGNQPPSAGITNLAKVNAGFLMPVSGSNGPAGLGGNNTVSVCETTTIILGPNQSWSGTPYISNTNMGVGYAHLTASALEILT